MNVRFDLVTITHSLECWCENWQNLFEYQVDFDNSHSIKRFGWKDGNCFLLVPNVKEVEEWKRKKITTPKNV